MLSQVHGGNVETASRRFVLLTAAFNEEAYIEETIHSVLGQLVRPSVWVIVSDGSSDRTEEIVQRYTSKHSFIRLLRRERDDNRRFASKVFALRAGLELLSCYKSQFIAHLDADISLDPFYFRDLLSKFDEDPALGLAGGWYLERQGGQFRPSRGSSISSVPGCAEMFRRQCYEVIGGLLPIEYGGEDWYAEIMARKSGWKARSFPELAVRHLRDTGTAGNPLRYCYRQGFADFALGSHPLFEAVKLARRFAWPPCVIGATARFVGFLVAHFCIQKAIPADAVTFVRNEQLSRLMSGIIGLLGLRSSTKLSSPARLPRLYRVQ